MIVLIMSRLKGAAELTIPLTEERSNLSAEGCLDKSRATGGTKGIMVTCKQHFYFLLHETKVPRKLF
jgi:hypothetical protein